MLPRLAAAESPAPATPAARVTFVANTENLTQPRVRYTGRAWAADPGGFLRGTGAGHRLLTESAPGEGDFRLEFDLALPRAGRTSALVVGDDSSWEWTAGETTSTLRGRFFLAADAPLTVPVPRLAPGQRFDLEIARQGATVQLRVNGQLVHEGPCRPAALGLLGLDPGTGTIDVYSLHATARFPDAAPVRAFDNPFGMQLRPRPRDLAGVWAPALVQEAPTNEPCLVARRDGSLELYSITKPASDSVSVQRSLDGGLTWTEPSVAFHLPGRAYYAILALEAADGSLHAVVHLQGQGPGGYRGRLYEVYHTRRLPGAASWSPARRVVPGYVGSLNGFIPLSGSGRLLLAVARAVPEREAPPASGPDRGWNDTFVYLTDDQGETWRTSPDVLSLELSGPNATRYGAIEPALLELSGGRVWMLVRDRGGVLWQSTSPDGERWPELVRTAFISSDSPADLLRLRDGRILLLTNACQNWTDPRSYAMGGREVLHAALSSDEGRTWRGFREILHETRRISGGDRGTSYASVVQNQQGQVVVASGQGEGKRALLLFHPDWLEETKLQDDLSQGPVHWNQYGDDGLHVVEEADGRKSLALPLKASGPCGALWNFPAATAGTLRLRIKIPAGVRELTLSLHDHFNRIDDRQAVAHAVVALEGATLATDAPDRWQEVVLSWSDLSTPRGTWQASIDGRSTGRRPAPRVSAFGPNYLRIEFRGRTEQGAVLVSDLSMNVLP